MKMTKRNKATRERNGAISVPFHGLTRIESKIEYNCLVHTLTYRGLHLVRRKNLDNGSTKSGQEIQNIDHEIGILRYRLALRKWCKENGYVLYWTQAGLKTATVSADALYYVYDPKTDTRYGPFFLEYEKQKRGKYDDDGKPQVIRKLLQFDKYYGSDQCMKDFKFRQFYVTTVLRTERKRKFLLHDLAENGCKKLRFWLTTEDLALQNIGGQIFQTPKDHQEQAYSLLSE